MSGGKRQKWLFLLSGWDSYHLRTIVNIVCTEDGLNSDIYVLYQCVTKRCITI